jgi:hypothetical protein
MTTEIESDSACPEGPDPEGMIRLSGNAPIEVFPFITIFHHEIVLRHHDNESQDIEMSPDEADALADLLRKAAAIVRKG